jgi:hypothetical protein
MRVDLILYLVLFSISLISVIIRKTLKFKTQTP